jgi:stage II sporulation protein D
MQLTRRGIRKTALILLILALIMLTALPLTAQANNYNMIRVMLLSGQSNFENSFTASSTNGFKITNITGATGQFSYNASSSEIVGLQLEGYSLLVTHTSDRQMANSAAERVKLVKAHKLNPLIEVATDGSRNIYRVTVGNFATEEQANSVRMAMAADQQISSTVIGVNRWVASGYGSLDEAKSFASQLNSAGYIAYPGQYLDGSAGYVVFIGDAAGTTEHNQLKSMVEQSYSVTLAAPTSDTFVIHKEFARISGTDLSKYKLFSFSRNAIVKLENASENSSIKIDERVYQGRSISYRGEINLRLFNGELKLVNFLPLETYLWSVVGSEMYSGWPLESQKAQAVTARTFAYQKQLNPRNSIADIYDTTDDQAYFGVAQEASSITQAVNETRGIVALYNGSTFNTFYSANAGGMTAHGTEIWGNNVPSTFVKESSWDKQAEINAKDWYRVILPSGITGYVRSDFITLSGTENSLGFKYGSLNGTEVNMRTGPSTIYCTVKMVLDLGQQVLILETVKENNAYSWRTTPITAEYVMNRINQFQADTGGGRTSPVLDLKVASVGPSGRVMTLVDGNGVISIRYPDYYRTMLGSTSTGVLSNFFEIEQTGRIEVLGAHGESASMVNASNQLYVASSDNTTVLASTNNSQDEYLVLNATGEVRVVSKAQSYVLHGRGWGHGIGMSQWGARGMAEEGYNYRQILEYYYKNVELKQIY